MTQWTKTDNQAGKPKYLRVGQILGINIAGTMANYVDGASLTISAPPAGGVQAVGTIKVTAGAITGVTMTNPGAGYLVAPTITAPAGTGATLTATVKNSKIGNLTNADVVFVSREESALAANRLKGIRNPGWWKVTERLQSDGAVRYMSECLVALDDVNANTGDNVDDAVVGDIEISFSAQPADSSVTAPATATFTVTAVAATGYQWQVQTGGTGAYANVAGGTGGTTASYTTAATNTGMTGNRYRCVATNASATVKSKGAKLTAV